LVFGLIVGQNDHDPEGKKSRTAEGEEGPGTKKEEELSAEVRKKNPPEENTISNRRPYCIFIPPLTMNTKRPQNGWN
jgi:hypothetical protein